MQYPATYAGTVEDTRDPEQLGRMKVRVPSVYGPDALGNTIATSDLPWALPAGLPAGGSSQSGAIQWLPEVGDHVFVRFLDGEPEKPVWEWAGQDRRQATEYPYLRRQPGGYQEDGSAPRSALLTRYDHLVDIQEDTVTIRTKSGYKLRFTDSTGKLDVYAPTVDVLLEALKVTGVTASVNVNDLAVTAAVAKVSANDLDMETLTARLVSLVEAKVTSPHIELGPEGSAVDPVVRLSDLKLVVQVITTVFNAHKHIAVKLGAPTTPPLAPMVVVPTASQTTFTA